MNVGMLVAVAMVAWMVGAMFAVPLTDGGEEHPWGIGAVFFWPLAILWAVMTRGCRLAAHFAPTEAARLRRRIYAVDRELRLLSLRAELERKEAAYRAEFDHYVERGIR